jgi:di/tricarboxylate transporter
MIEMPHLPNPHAIAMMALTVVALVLFSREELKLEITALCLLGIIVLGFAVAPFEEVKATDFFAGLAHEALISVCALMVLGQGLVRTGALEPVGRILSGLWGKAPVFSLLLTLIVGGVLSAFVNNTPIVVLLLPILISVCLRTNKSPSKVLMPMGFATLVGGMATTIGTSTNLLVVSLAQEQGLKEFGMFDFALPALLSSGVALLYLWLIAPKLLPDRISNLSDHSPRLFEARLQISPDSHMIGKTFAEARTAAGPTMQVQRILRDDTVVMPLPDLILAEGDRLRIRDTPQNLKQYEEALEGVLYADIEKPQADSSKNTSRNASKNLSEETSAYSTTPISDEHPLTADDQTLVEVAVVQGSDLDQTNLGETRFIQQHQLVVLALHRAGKDIWQASQEIQQVILRPGDVLLLQGAKNQVSQLKSSTEFLVLDGSITLPKTEKAPIALAIITSVVVLAGTGLLPISVAALTGTAAMLLTRCLSTGAAIRAVSPSVYFVVASSLALGMALQKTGATIYLTEIFLFATQGASPTIILSALMLLLAILTNVVSNNAAAVIGTPIAIGIANYLQLPAEAFVLAVLFGANMSYATPMAYKTNLLVMSAGNYTFGDFVKVGLPLTLIMWITLSYLLSVIYL